MSRQISISQIENSGFTRRLQEDGEGEEKYYEERNFKLPQSFRSDWLSPSRIDH